MTNQSKPVHFCTRVQTLLAFMLINSVASAATFSVSNANDSGTGSLRQAILNANAATGNSHLIQRSTGTDAVSIFLESPLPTLNKPSLELDLPNMTLLPDDASNSFRLLTAGAAIEHLTLKNFQLRFGRTNSGEGGGCLASTAATGNQVLTMDNMQFSSCVASPTDSARGGAVYWNRGQVTITGSLFVDNLALSNTQQSAGGAIYAVELNVDDSVFINNQVQTTAASFGGAINTVGTLIVSRSRFMMNKALAIAGGNAGAGGAIYAGCSACTNSISQSYFGRNQADNGGAVTVNDQSAPFENSAFLTNLTFDSNSTLSFGAALWLLRTNLVAAHLSFQDNIASTSINNPTTDISILSGSIASLHNSVFGRAGLPAHPNCSGPMASSGFGNISTDASCTAMLPLAQQLGTSAVTGTVNLFESMPVIRYPANSPAVDGASDAVCAVLDVRGTPRPQDGDNDGLARCDVGAFELPADRFFRNGFE